MDGNYVWPVIGVVGPQDAPVIDESKKRRQVLTVGGIGILLFGVLCLLLDLSHAEASWLIDPLRFHASVHGQTSCLECHEGIADQALHPDPFDVTKAAGGFFEPGHCFGCHDSVMDDLDQGTHGALKVKEKKKYLECLSCHDPHYQVGLGESKVTGFDPAKPVSGQCGVCHEPEKELPPASAEDAGCMSCHLGMKTGSGADTKKINGLCFHCHGRSGTRAQAVTEKTVPLMDDQVHAATVHGDLACTSCHRGAAAFSHQEQVRSGCASCHLPHHDEKTAHDAHISVSCEACHLKGVLPVRDAGSKEILWKKAPSLNDASLLHQMVPFDGERSCRRCHFPGNALGAAAMVLPPKGVLCMPCHTATFSVGDTVTLTALVVFLCGIVLFGAFLLSGSMSRRVEGNPLAGLSRSLGRGMGAIFSPRIIPIARSLLWDVFLQRRLYRESPGRWAIHGLIFYPFVFRFSWGLVALLCSLWSPEWPATWNMVDKNWPLTAFLFDLTGLMLLAGVVSAFLRGWLSRATRAPGLPEQDRLALGLIGGIVVIGFLIEGMRIALTGYPAGSGFSFIGYWIGTMFSNPRGLTEVYGFVWYIHAILTGVFIAYIPFSRLIHMIVAPVVAVVNVVSAHENR